MVAGRPYSQSCEAYVLPVLVEVRVHLNGTPYLCETYKSL